jgi:hypothetical protein
VPVPSPTADRVTHGSEQERVKKSPVFADEYTKCSGADRHPAAETSRGTGEDLETRRVFDLVFFFFDLPARHGDVRKFRQSGGKKQRIWFFS